MKVRILENSGWCFIYADGELISKQMFNHLDFISNVLSCIGMKYKKFNDAYELDLFMEYHRVFEDIDVRRFVFTDDDYIFTPYKLGRQIDPEAVENFEEVEYYLKNKYKYRDSEKREIEIFCQ